MATLREPSGRRSWLIRELPVSVTFVAQAVRPVNRPVWTPRNSAMPRRADDDPGRTHTCLDTISDRERTQTDVLSERLATDIPDQRVTRREAAWLFEAGR